MKNHSAYIGIGSNVGDPVANVRRAIDALREAGVVAVQSSLYRTKPWGKTDQPEFINAVVRLETALQPRALLDTLKRLEKQLGRTEDEHWGPRVIDLDLLTYDDRTIDEPGLRIPHPELKDRAFVLVPLAEIDSTYAPWRDVLAPDEIAGVRPIRH